MTVLRRGYTAATPEKDVLSRIVDLGCRAPSVHNTQPWRWRIEGSRVELRADRSRQLAVSDPEGRNLTISCGAALHHVQIAAAGLGRHASIERWPDPNEPDLFAVVDLHPQEPATASDLDLLAALEARCTDRRRFTSWPVPDERLEVLASVAQRWGTRVLPLTGASARATTERLADRAREIQFRDPRLVGEQEQWINHGPDDGLPSSSLPSQQHRDEWPDRFDRGATSGLSQRWVDSSDAVLAVCTAHDDPRAWLDAGETLSAVWLHAALSGFSLVPLSQVIEVEETREELRRDVFYDMAQPQLLLRIGWQEFNRPPLPRSPRRPLADVLDVVSPPDITAQG